MPAQATETPVFDIVKKMTADSLEVTTLDPEAVMLVRIAALVAVDAPPISYTLNLAAAKETGIDEDKIRGVFTAIAPIVGTPHIASAMGNIVRGLGIESALNEIEDELEPEV